MNIIAYFVMIFQSYILLNFMASFLSFLVTSPDYYDVPKDHAGRVVGDLGFYGTISVMAFDLVLGTLMDLIGRKLPIIYGLLYSSCVIVSMPFGHNVYPTLLIWR